MGTCFSCLRDLFSQRYCIKCGVRYNYYNNYQHASRRSCRYNLDNKYSNTGYHIWSEPLF